MSAATTVVDPDLPAHAVHLVLVLLGLWALAALLLPQALERHGRRHGSGPAGLGPAARDRHAVRVHELRAAAATGALATLHTAVPAAPGSPPPAATPTATPAVPDTSGPEPVLGLPLAVVAGTAAAAVHAAVVPAHLVEAPLSAAFFVLVAGLQLAWVADLTHPEAPARAVLVRGVVLQGALVALWAVTRLTALPLGLLPETHPVGAWDVTCVLWELVCLAACVRVLRRGAVVPLPSWTAWHPTSRGAVGAAAVMMVLLTAIGAHS